MAQDLDTVLGVVPKARREGLGVLGVGHLGPGSWFKAVSGLLGFRVLAWGFGLYRFGVVF